MIIAMQNNLTLVFSYVLWIFLLLSFCLFVSERGGVGGGGRRVGSRARSLLMCYVGEDVCFRIHCVRLVYHSWDE